MRFREEVARVSGGCRCHVGRNLPARQVVSELPLLSISRTATSISSTQ